MKKFELNYLLFCDHTIQDIRGKISLMGIFENLNAKVFPTTLVSFVVAGNAKIIDNSIKEIKVELEILDTENKPLIPNRPTLNIKGLPLAINTRSFNFLFTLQNLPFKQKGNYKFIVVANEETIGKLILEARTVN